MADPNTDPAQLNKTAQGQEAVAKAVLKSAESYGKQKDSIRKVVEELGRYERVSKGVSRSYQALDRAIEEFNSKQKEATKRFVDSQKNYEKSGESIVAFAKKVEVAERSMAKARPGSRELKRSTAVYKELTKELARQKKAHTELEIAHKTALSDIKEYRRYSKEIGRYQEHYNKLLDKPTKNMEEMNRLLNARYTMQKRIAERTTDEVERTKKLAELEKEREQVALHAVRERVSQGTADSDIQKRMERESENRRLVRGRETLGTGAGMEFGKNALGRAGDVGAHAGALLSRRGSLKDRFNSVLGLKDAAANAKDFKSRALGGWSEKYDKEFAKTGKSVTGLSKSVKFMAGNFQMLKMVIDGLGKGNILMALISALAALAQAAASAVFEIDKWYKDINKKFYNMAGPAVGMKDSTASMKKFGAAVFDMNRNIKLGLKSEQIYSMFNAFTEAGMSLQGFLSKSPTSGAADSIDEYSEAITTARELSIKMGVDFEKMGGMMGDAMTNLRMDMDEVRDTFSKVAYDAASAGIQTNKFYGAINAATNSLSFYGKFLGNASAMLTKFTKQGLMGFEDASKQVQSMMGGAAKKDFGQALGMVQLSRGIYDKESVRLAEEQDKQALEAEDNVKKLRALLVDSEKSGSRMSDADRAGLQEKIDAQSQMAENARVTAKRFRDNVGNVVNTANDIARYEAVSMEAMVTRLKGMKLDLTKRGVMETITKQYLVASGDMDKDSADRLAASANQFYESFIYFAENNASLLDKFADKNSEAFAQFEKGVKDFADGANFDDVWTGVEASLRAAKFKGEDIVAVRSKMSRDPAMFAKYVEGMKTGGLYRGTDADTGKKVASREFAKDAAFSELGSIMKGRKGSATAKDTEAKQMDEVIGNTRSMADIFDISKESLKYSYAQSDTQKALVGLATGTLEKMTGILGLLTSWFNKANPALKKKSEEFMAGSDDKKYAVNLFAQKFSLESKMAEARKKGEDTSAMNAKLKVIDAELSRQENTGRFADVFAMNKQQLAVEGRMLSDKMSLSQTLDPSKPEDKKRQEDIYRELSGATRATPDKVKATGDLLTDYLFTTALGAIGAALGTVVMPGVGTVAGAGAGVALGQALTGDRADAWKDLTGSPITGSGAVGAMTRSGGTNATGGKGSAVQSIINIDTFLGDAKELQRIVENGVSYGVRKSFYDIKARFGTSMF